MHLFQQFQWLITINFRQSIIFQHTKLNSISLKLIIFQIAKFLGGESSPLILEQDPSGVFITSLEVDRIEADSGDTYGCQPNPGVAAEVKVHVIKEGN